MGDSGGLDFNREDPFVREDPKISRTGFDQQRPAAEQRGRCIASIGQGLRQVLPRVGPQMKACFGLSGRFAAREKKNGIQSRVIDRFSQSRRGPFLHSQQRTPLLGGQIEPPEIPQRVEGAGERFEACFSRAFLPLPISEAAQHEPGLAILSWEQPRRKGWFLLPAPLSRLVCESRRDRTLCFRKAPLRPALLMIKNATWIRF